MGRKKKSTGDFDREKNILIYKDLLNGVRIKDINKKYSIYTNLEIHYEFFIKSKYTEYINRRGYYYTEQELIDGIPKYKFQTLTIYEKQFYLNYNKQLKNGKRTN